MALGDQSRKSKVKPLAEIREQATADSGPMLDDKGADDGVSEHHEFNLDYIDHGRKRRWTGHFKCHVPSIRETIEIGRVAAELRGHVSPSALDMTTFQLTEMLATLTITLDATPAWARGDSLLDMRDGNVIATIYKEVRDHFARFWGTDTEAAHGANGQGTSSGGPRGDLAREGDREDDTEG